MKIEYLKGDVIQLAREHSIKYIAHGVNCQGVMGSGVAKVLKDEFPEIYVAFLEIFKQVKGDAKQLIGTVQDVECLDGQQHVLNCFTQKFFGNDGKRYLSYDALAACMQAINNMLTEKVIMPKIGSHLAGGNWNIIEQIIQEEATNFQPIVAVL